MRKLTLTCNWNIKMCSLYKSGYHSDQFSVQPLWDMVEEEMHIIDVQQWYVAIMSVWTKISKECIHQLVEVCLSILKAKSVQNFD